MSVVPTVSADGIGVIAAGQLNAYMIGASNTAVMRTVVGQPGMTIYLQGTNVPNDGGQGTFYWNYASVAADNNTSIIVPNGVVQGAWIRQSVVITNSAPAFGAYANTNQSLASGTPAKVQINTKEFDTNACYDNTTNYRFTPTTAGYYQVNGAVQISVTSGTVSSVTLYRNGTAYKSGSSNTLSSGTYSVANCTVSALIYFNGSTDYVELWASSTGTSPSIISGQAATYFSASLTRNQ